MNIDQPTPELPVSNVREAQEYYRDKLGFEVAWFDEGGRIGAVSHGKCAIFFRESTQSQSSTFLVYCDDVDEAYADLTERGADIREQLEDKPWGLRQFTVCDRFENQFYFFHDL